MSGFSNLLQSELRSEEFRKSYVAENLRRGVAYQIRAMRDSRGWSQAELGRKTDKPQSNVSRWEDPNYGKFSLQTLLEIAAAFDVGLLVRLVSFDELVERTADLSMSALNAESYGSYPKTTLPSSEYQVGTAAMAASAEPPEQEKRFSRSRMMMESHLGERDLAQATQFGLPPRQRIARTMELAQ